MKLCFLANAGSIHAAKWANYFSRRGHEVHVISYHAGRELDSGVFTHRLGPVWPLSMHYFLDGSDVRRLVHRLKPDLVHSHYASGYGTLGRLTRFRPRIVSVWGSDIYEFPSRSVLHRWLIKENLRGADRVCSTSQAMARETTRYYDGPVEITPFGIDCDQFRPQSDAKHFSDDFVVGAVGWLLPVYGFEYLIRAFALISERYRRQRRLRLVIVGEGYLRKSLEALCAELVLADSVNFLGQVPNQKVSEILNSFSVFAAPFLESSFGVSVLEASACGLPVVVSEVGGLPEVIRNGQTGFVVPPANTEAIAHALRQLIENDDLRRDMGSAGRRFVLENYEWTESASKMERIYESVLSATGVSSLRQQRDFRQDGNANLPRVRPQ